MPRQSLDDWTDEIAERISKKNPPVPTTRKLPHVEPTADNLQNLLKILQERDPENFPRLLEEAIVHAFMRRTTPQGAEFWLTIFDKLKGR